MTPILAWLVGIPLLGALTGNRTMTPIAVLCWFGWAHHLGARDTWGIWATYLVTAIVFTVLALGELIGDKLRSTPNRTSAFALIARICFGGLCGALASIPLRGDWLEGALLGSISAAMGTFLGFHLRHYLVHTAGWKDMYVAIAEDLTTIGLAVIAMGIITA